MDIALMSADQDPAALQPCRSTGLTMVQAPVALQCGDYLEGLGQGFAGAAPGEGPQEDG